MGLSSLFKRPAAAAPAGVDAAQAVDAARTRARRRLIGAVLLLGVGVIAFPLLFETHPRPIPVDIPIEIPRKDGAPALALPAPRAAAPSVAAAASKPVLAAETPVPAVPVITESKADAGRDVAPAVEAPAKAAPKTEAATKPVAPNPAPPSTATTSDAKASEAPGRFVVQVGAFADAAMAREARTKVEKLGLRTYTQAVDTEGGKRTRVRVGPFVSRDEADQVATRVKAAGFQPAVLAL